MGRYSEIRHARCYAPVLPRAEADLLAGANAVLASEIGRTVYN